MTITYYIQGVITPTVTTRTVPAGTVLQESVNNDVGPDKVVAAVVTSAQALHVTRTMSRISASGARLDGSTTAPARAPSASWGFPEGYTGITFQEYLTLLNPGSSPAAVTVKLAPQATSAAGARSVNVTVAAHSRSTTNIRSLNAGGTASVGMLVSSSVPIVAERVEYFGSGSGSGKFGSTVSMGIITPAKSLFVAYGTSAGSVAGTGGSLQPIGDQDYITLLNPSSTTPVTVTARFGDNTGKQIGKLITVSVSAGARQTIAANAALGTAAVTAFSVTLDATGPIEAETAQYYGGSPNDGSHPGVAFTALANGASAVLFSSIATQLADGTSVQQSVFLYNPGAAVAQVAATFFGPSGAPTHATYSVPAGGLTTVNVNTAGGSALPAGPRGAEFQVTNGTIAASAVGMTSDNQSAIEEVGAPLS